MNIDPETITLAEPDIEAACLRIREHVRVCAEAVVAVVDTGFVHPGAGRPFTAADGSKWTPPIVKAPHWAPHLID